MNACCGPSRTGRSTVAQGRHVPTSHTTIEIAAPDRLDAEFVSIPGGTYLMGTNDHQGYVADGEGPVHQVSVEPFLLAPCTVTNEEFARFVTATGYRTTAEQIGTSFVFAGLLPAEHPDTRAVAGAPWWREVPGANWKHPEGENSHIDDRSDHPVVHVSWLDATKYCDWSGTRLTSEAEWEYAARGGLVGAHYPWGDDLLADRKHRMNVFQGDFPDHDTGADGFVGTCPVASFPPNGFGLFEMTGNVWEWCADWYDATYYERCPLISPRGPSVGHARVLRGGSYMCHHSYCWRYRVDARSFNTPESSTGNIGFRVAQ